MIVREVLDTSYFPSVSVAQLLVRFDFFHDYGDTCQFLRRMIELERNVERAQQVLANLKAAHELYIKKRQREWEEDHKRCLDETS